MKEISALEEQIGRLNAKDFDLEAWKQHTSAVLGRIFGDNSLKIKQIQKIEYDYSSWSLRDTSGRSSNLERCKKMGREILMAAIEELKTFGIPDNTSAKTSAIPPEVIGHALENELKVSQIRGLIAVIDSDKSAEDKKESLLTLLKKLEPGASEAILAHLLAHPGMTGKLKM
ncbi:MAG: hypothetical protein JXA03_02020 [Bacteroidales bacterium]|nr:hypothetical protein [Bacteroidales bacterium]